MPDKLTIISNESISADKGIFYCDNIELKSIPEGLSNNYEVLNIGRKSKVKRSFKINWINEDSRFHIFLGLDYPTLAHAREAHESGMLSEPEFYDYLTYYRQHGAPPQDTVLGGSIGIHGLGEADPNVHQRYHWTDGCVAVTNDQIEKLATLVRLGTKVIIR